MSMHETIKVRYANIIGNISEFKGDVPMVPDSAWNQFLHKIF